MASFSECSTLARNMIDSGTEYYNYGPPPSSLDLVRTGLMDVELRDPNSGKTIYKILERDRSSLSSKPDFEFYRTPANDQTVGSLRFGKLSTEIQMASTGVKSKGIEQVTLHHLRPEPSNLVWKTVKNRKPQVKMNWVKTNESGQPLRTVEDDVIVIALVDAQSQMQSPECVVRLWGTQPKGVFEIWAPAAQVNEGGSWDALDELVVTGYANMEATVRELVKRVDSHWAHGGSRWI